MAADVSSNYIMGVGSLLHAAASTAPPTLPVADIHAVTGWTYAGDTVSGVRFANTANSETFETDQSDGPVIDTIVTQETTLETQLARQTAANLALVMNNRTVVTAGVAGSITKTVPFGMGKTKSPIALMFLTESADEAGGQAIYYIPMAVQTGNNQREWNKGGTDTAAVPLSVTAIRDTTKAAGYEYGHYVGEAG